MSFFSMSSLKSAWDAASQVAATLSLDNLQGEFGAEEAARKASRQALDLTYLTPRIIAMGFPSSPTSKLRSRNDITAVAAHFHAEHGAGNVMVWNLSEETYDYAQFDAQVVEVRCFGSPSPPLGLMAKVCQGVETWLAADPAHVAAIRAFGPALLPFARRHPTLFIPPPSPRPPTTRRRRRRRRLHDG